MLIPLSLQVLLLSLPLNGQMSLYLLLDPFRGHIHLSSISDGTLDLLLFFIAYLKLSGLPIRMSEAMRKSGLISSLLPRKMKVRMMVGKVIKMVLNQPGRRRKDKRRVSSTNLKILIGVVSAFKFGLAINFGFFQRKTNSNYLIVLFNLFWLAGIFAFSVFLYKRAEVFFPEDDTCGILN